jgi:hypothetical protein
MPFGTKEIADTSKELADSVKLMINGTTELGKGTQILAQASQGLIDSTSEFQKSTQFMAENTEKLVNEMQGFRQDMQLLSTEMGKMTNSLEKTADVLTAQLSQLNNTLADFGKNMTKSMMSNLREEASSSFGKLIPGLPNILGKKDEKKSYNERNKQ